MSETELKEVPAEEAAAEEERSSAGGRRLTPAEWLEIETHIECDTLSANEIREKYGISSQAIYKHIKKRFEDDGYKIERGSKRAVVKAATTAAVATTVATTTAAATTAEPPKESFEQKRRQRIENARENRYLAAEQQFRLLVKRQQAIVGGTAPIDVKELRQLAVVLRENTDLIYKILKAEEAIDPNELPELRIKDLSDEEILALQSREDEDEGETLGETDPPKEAAAEEDDIGDDDIIESGGK
jgi:biotin operon repressor